MAKIIGNKSKNWTYIQVALILKYFIIISIINISGISCVEYPGKYTPPKLERAEMPSPKDNFIKLCKFFKDFDGNLITSEDEDVIWKDTELFRMFEFKNHTAIIFPHNWNSNGFDLILFSGHIKNYDKPYDSIFYKYDQEKSISYNDTITFKQLNPVTHQVYFEGFYLGESKDSIIEKARVLINHQLTNEKQKRLALDNMNYFQEMSSGSAKKSEFNFYFEDGKLSYMNFYIKGFPQLGGYKINEPKTPIISEGRFKIPPECKEKKRVGS